MNTTRNEESTASNMVPRTRTTVPRSKQVFVPDWSSISKKRRQAAGPMKVSPVSGPGPVSIPKQGQSYDCQPTRSVEPHHLHSNSIPLPKSHIHRTPSELQLADDMRTAEFQDVRMYARLLVGMQSQIQNQCVASGGYVHPLSRKSLQGIIMTKQGANDGHCSQQKSQYEEDQDDSYFIATKENQSDFQRVDDGWDVSYIDEEASTLSPYGTAPVAKSPSDGSISTMSHQAERYYVEGDNGAHNDDLEDDCVFSLEL